MRGTRYMPRIAMALNKQVYMPRKTSTTLWAAGEGKESVHVGRV